VKEKTMSGTFGKRLAILVGALLLVGFGFVLGTSVLNTSAGTVTFIQQVPPAAFQPDPLTENERYFADIYTRVSPSVVSISAIADDPFHEGLEGIFEASGTGFVIDTQGHIITNAHVIDGAVSIEVNFIDGTIVPASLVGADLASDIAVLKVELPAERLTPVPFGNSDQLFIGETTLAIGSPFGQRWTLTTGIISALDRTITGLTRFSVGSVIQTDAAINPGNSGGPLLNLQGEVIGVNSQIQSETRSNSGIGFAVPSNLVKRVAAELIEKGRVDYSYLGIEAQGDLSLALIEALKLPNNLRGVVIATVVDGSPAERAGLRDATTRVQGDTRVLASADIITAIDQQPIFGMSSLVSYLANNTVPGQTITLSVWRDGEEIALPVVLSARPSD
jgi:2-alkenal reductase